MGAAARKVILGAACLRALATGMAGVLLGVYLAELGLGPGQVGAVAGAGLAGAATGALVVTLRGRHAGRGALLTLALLAAGGGALLALVSHPLALAAVAFLGMVNGMGRDRGPSAVLEQSLLPATVPPERRTSTFAWYTALQDAGHSLGSLAAGLPALLAAALPLAGVASYRACFGLYSLLLLASALLYLALPARPRESAGAATATTRSPRRAALPTQPVFMRQHLSSTPAASPPARLSPASRRILTRISLLFALDGLGGGLLLTTLLSYFFFERFGVGVAALSGLFFAARVANLLSNFGAAWLSRRIGLVNTMVLTHIPASLLLVAVAFVPSFPLAAALFLLRESLVEMDVPTRQSYVMAVVRPEERTTASGLTNLVRLAMWALGPSLGGWAMQALGLAAPLLAGAGIKIVYDLLLFASFRRLRPPEES
jgi:MFS family permease